MPALVRALNKVDFPTLGRPTIPHFKLMSVLENQARKCMRCVLRGAGALVLLCGGLAASAAAPPTTPANRAAVLLADGQAPVDAMEGATAWVDAHGTATFEQVMQGSAGAFQSAPS